MAEGSVTAPYVGGAVAELCARALHVTGVEIYVDHETLDRLFVIHTEESPPLVFRVSPVDLTVILKDLADVIAKSMN